MRRLFALWIALAAILCTASAQQIALPPGSVEGYLRNGLHYIIKPNALPRHTAEFRLVMRVGSLMETDEQLGGAHFLEHLAFAGMHQFPGNAMVDYFERQGMKFGRDINAFTGFDRTIYWFTVPTFGDAAAVMDTTLQVVRGLLTDITFDEQRTLKERGVIIEELRSYDVQDPFYALKIGNGRYASRMPLGSEADIQRIDRRRLIDFYQQWYAPQFATLIVVGDVDATTMAEAIEQRLASVPVRGASRLPRYPLSYAKGAQLMEVDDSIDASSRLELMIPHRTTVGSTIATTVEKRRDELLVQCLSERLSRRGIPCTVSDQWYLADQNHFVLAFSGAHKDSLTAYIARTAAEMKQLAADGPGREELNRQIQRLNSRQHCDTLQALSEKWCDDLIDGVVAGDRYIHRMDELMAVKRGLAQTTPRHLQRRARALLHAMKHHLLIAYTNNHGAAERLTEAEVELAWEQGKAADAHPFTATEPVATDDDQPRYPVPPVLAAHHAYIDSVAVSARRSYTELGVSEVVLRNGVRLLFRPTLDDEARLQLMALGRGGTAHLDDDAYYRLKDAVAYLDMGGLATVDADTLMEVMGQRQVSLNVGLEDHWHELMATADVADAQLLMNLAYEKMHHPRRSYEDFDETKASELAAWGQETLLARMMRRDASRLLNNRADSLLGNTESHRRPMRRSDLEAADLDEMGRYYHQLFTDPEGLTLLFTGPFALQEIEPMAIGTFARMQRPDSALTIADQRFVPTASYEERFDNDNPSQTILNFIFAGNYEPSLQTTLTFKLMRDLLQQRMLQVLREQLNIVYSPYSDLYYSGLPQRTYYFWLTTSVKNENSEQLQQALRALIADLQQHPVSTAELEKMKRSFLVTKSRQLSDVAPTEWKNTLTGLLKNGESLTDFDRYEQVLGQITPERVRQAFCDYIDTDHFILMYQAK